MFLPFICLLFFASLRPSYGQNIPLYYQLLEAYKPISTYTYTPTPTPTKTITSSIPQSTFNNFTNNSQSNSSSLAPSLSLLAGQILGAATSNGQTITVGVLGDSMTSSLGPNISQLELSLRKYYPNYQFKLLNYGSGDNNIEDGFFRLQNNYEYLGRQVPSLLSQNPNIIVVESFAYNNFGNTQEGINRHWVNLNAIVSSINQKSPQTKVVIATTIAPNSAIYGNSNPNLNLNAMQKIEATTAIKLYSQNSINFAKTSNLPLADSFTPSMTNGDGLRDFISTEDNTHPSNLGIQLFCDTVAKTIFDYRLI